MNPQQLYYIRNANGTASSFNPNFFPRDWSDGDDGGYDTIATPGTAKNVLTVGACLDVVTPSGEPGFAPGSVVTPAEFSGAGPLDDGRIKPDLVAVGDVSASARSTVGVPVTDGLVTTDSLANNSYNDELARGTSFSAPAVAGGCALMLERRAELYPGLAPEDMWLSSTIKALAINGCDDVGLEGPDYRMGHGLFNAATSVAQIDEDHAGGRGSQIKEFDLDPNQSVSWLVNVEAGEPLAITLAWVDPAGTGISIGAVADDSTPALVNNIDIKIENISNGQTLLPWTLNPDLVGKSAGVRQAQAVRGLDNVNNVERITSASPVAGTYRITVSHEGATTGTASAQEVSVISTNAMPLIPVIDSVEVSPAQDEFIFTYVSDPGAHYTIETSTTLEVASWSEVGTTVAGSNVNTVMVDIPAGNTRRFWRLKRQ